MTNSIKNLNSAELSLICGGVIEGPDGRGCTEPDGKGGPGGTVVVVIGTVGPTIEIDVNI